MAIGALSVVSLILWYLFPMLNLVQLDTVDYWNASDPIVSLSLSMANSFFLILGLVGFLVCGFLLYTQAIKGGDMG